MFFVIRVVIFGRIRNPAKILPSYLPSDASACAGCSPSFQRAGTAWRAGDGDARPVSSCVGVVGVGVSSSSVQSVGNAWCGGCGDVGRSCGRGVRENDRRWWKGGECELSALWEACAIPRKMAFVL